MKFWTSIILLITFPIIAHAEKINFDFFDASGGRYSIFELTRQLNEKYNYTFSPSVLLVETPDFTDQKYLNQSAILEQIDSEDLQLIFVIASPFGEYEHGYHTTIEVAQTIMDDIPKFRVRILNTNGLIIFESEENISSERIEKIVRNQKGS